MRIFATILCLSFLPVSLYAPAQDVPTPTVDGYITAITSKTEFDVNGQHVITTPKTEYIQRTVIKQQETDTTDPNIAGSLKVGDNVQVFSKSTHKHPILATQIVLQQQSGDLVSGVAAIQKIIKNAPDMILEADGYQIAISPKTNIHYGAHLSKNTVLAPGMWIEYSGNWRPDGTVLASHAKFTQFSLTSRYKKMLAMHSNATIFPENTDSKTVKRVQQIGMRLVPAYQKNLATNDPQKINFQFDAAISDVSNGYRLPIPIAMQNGHITLPRQLVERLQNDDQIAAVLANGIAKILEWQDPNSDAPQTTNKGFAKAGAMELLAGPYITLAAVEGGMRFDSEMNGTTILSKSAQQRARVGLSLMHDAGYDIMQAPRAWQIMGAKNIKKSASTATPQPTAMPQLSVYLWGIISREYLHGSNAVIASSKTTAGSK
jgi:hypothetical protein